MKIKIVLFAVLIVAFTSVNFAQIAKITPKKTVYTRAPKEGFEHKRTFTITAAKISGLSAALNKKTETALSFERVFDLNIEEEKKEIFWLEEADYKIEYNKNGVLSAALYVSGSGAYPSEYTKHVVVDLKTGNAVKAADVFVKLPQLAGFADTFLQARIKKEIAERRKDSAEDAQTMREMIAGAKFKPENLEFFSVSERGVSFYYDYGFPHVALALEPENRFFFTFAQLKPFIKPRGLLAGFVR
ncbi:MAG TPA: hypothetical protein VF692_02575 [Pyrinomonadaceae bacterium]|jgi:hypothetical protein